MSRYVLTLIVLTVFLGGCGKETSLALNDTTGGDRAITNGGPMPSPSPSPSGKCTSSVDPCVSDTTINPIPAYYSEAGH